MTDRARRILLSTLAFTFGVASVAHAAGADKVLAVVNGKPITESQIRVERAAELKALNTEYERNLYSLLETGLTDVINRQLLDAEAAARGVTRAEILAGIKAPAVTDADVEKFYDENKAKITRPKDEVLGPIRQYLEQQGMTTAGDELIAALRVKYKVVTKLEPLRTQVAATGPADGPANAPVTLVEFSDFQCPYCSQLFPTLAALKSKYGEKVRIVFRHYPLPSHPFAAKAAEASLCAHEQGKFWEMHDKMFQNQDALAVEDLKKAALTLGMDGEKFDSCLDSGKTASAVQRDMSDGQAAGVDGTPGMFINGRFLNGAMPLETISAIVDDELRRHGR